MKSGETLPARTPRGIYEIMMDIAELRAEAIAGRYQYLAYFLDMALIEAEMQRALAARLARMQSSPRSPSGALRAGGSDRGSPEGV